MSIFSATTYEDERCKKENPTVTDIVYDRVLARAYGHPVTPKSQQFLSIPFCLLDNSDFRNDFMSQKRFRTYLLLLRRISRASGSDYPVSVFQRYYCIGKLATSLSLPQMAKMLNISKSTASEHIQRLANDGVIQIETAHADETSDGHEHNIYVLGTHDGYTERWLAEDVFLNQSAKEVVRNGQ